MGYSGFGTAFLSLRRLGFKRSRTSNVAVAVAVVDTVSVGTVIVGTYGVKTAVAPELAENLVFPEAAAEAAAESVVKVRRGG